MEDGNQRGEERKVGKCYKRNCKICNLEDSIFNDWKEYLREELESSEFQKLKETLHHGRFYPQAKQIFAFTRHAKLKDIRVVIIGQDPYPQKDHAMGLSFSVPRSITKFPDSLQNIFTVLTSDIEGFEVPTSGNLKRWAKQGVLLLNAVLTTEPGVSKSHYGIGWEAITDQIVRSISLHGNNVVFMLWGDAAQEKLKQIKKPRNHKILKCSHPCTKSAYNKPLPFITCKHFSKANAYLEKNKQGSINWRL